MENLFREKLFAKSNRRRWKQRASKKLSLSFFFPPSLPRANAINKMGARLFHVAARGWKIQRLLLAPPFVHESTKFSVKYTRVPRLLSPPLFSVERQNERSVFCEGDPRMRPARPRAPQQVRQQKSPLGGGAAAGDKYRSNYSTRRPTRHTNRLVRAAARHFDARKVGMSSVSQLGCLTSVGNLNKTQSLHKINYILPLAF